jgi:hypothetical protein
VTWQPDPARILLGLAATRSKWPSTEYTFVLPVAALPVYYGHQEHLFASHGGRLDASIGTARLFHEVDGQGLITLIELGARYAADPPRGLSIGYCLDPQPSGPTQIYIREISLTSHPGDKDARVLSTGKLALADWELLR